MKHIRSISGILLIILVLIMCLAALAEDAPETLDAKQEETFIEIKSISGETLEKTIETEDQEDAAEVPLKTEENPEEIKTLEKTLASKTQDAAKIENEPSATGNEKQEKAEAQEELEKPNEDETHKTEEILENPVKTGADIIEFYEEIPEEIEEAPKSKQKNKEEEPEDYNKNASTESKNKPLQISEEDLVFIYENTETRLDEDPQELIEEIAKAEGQEFEIKPIRATEYSPEGTSYDGKGITIRSAKNEMDAEEIKAFFIDDESWKTARGIHVNATIEAVLYAYGKPTRAVNDILIYYEKGNEDSPALIFQMDDDNLYVISIGILKKYK